MSEQHMKKAPSPVEQKSQGTQVSFEDEGKGKKGKEKPNKCW